MVVKNNINFISKYIEKVCLDASKKYNRENDTKWQYTFIQGKEKNPYMIFVLDTKYIKVYKSIIYRLANNIEKHFDVIFKVVGINRNHNHYLLSFDYTNTDIKGFDIFVEDHGKIQLDPNYSICDWNVFNKNAIILCYCDDTLRNPQVNSTIPGHGCKHFYEMSRLHNVDMYRWNSWEEYSKDYMTLYNKKTLKIEETYKSM